MHDTKRKITPQEASNALRYHIIEKAHAIRQKYGNFIDYDTLLKVLDDRSVVRHPIRLEFNSQRIDQGLFAIVEAVSDDDPTKGYVIYIHEKFKDRLGDVPALVFYHLVVINYGDVATCDDAETFGALILNMEKDDYYQLLCRLADQV